MKARRGSGRLSLCAQAMLLVTIGVCSSVAAGPQQKPSAAPADTADYSWVPIADPDDVDIPPPPGDRWLVDDQGHEYTLFRWEKHPGYYRLADDARSVTLRYGIGFIVEHQDERYLYLRWYRTDTIAESLAADRAAAATREYRPQYRDAVAVQDRLRLEPWDEGLPKAGQWRNGFAVADFDGDGHLDLAHGPPRKGPIAEPVIFLSDGAGHWRHWTQARFPPLPYDYGDVAAGDLDGDGRVDLALTAHQRGIFALYGDGKGTFHSRSEGLPVRTAPPDPPSFTSRAIALADWNADGRLDLLALAEGPASFRDLAGAEQPNGKRIFLNRGERGWETLAGPGAMMGDTILPIDLDRDGRLDFVTDSRVAGSAELLNYGTPDGGGWTSTSLPEPHPGLRTRAVTVADFDGDGRPDLALAFGSREGSVAWHGVDVFFGAQDRGWRRSSVLGEADRRDGRETTAIAAGDLDGDGDADLVALAADGATRLATNDGRGGFELELTPEADPALDHRFCAGYGVAIVDLDRDGGNEVIAAFAGEPGSEAMFAGAIPRRCRAQGALRVWKVAR